jgi:translation initiation factor 2 alpha subunit (eIF-2alpha)
MEKDDLIQLISILIDRPKENIEIETEIIDFDNLSRIIEVRRIMIDGVNSFKDCFENIYEQMETDFCINLDYVQIPNYLFYQAYSSMC